MENKMNHKDILMHCAVTVNERGQDYGDVNFMFETAAQMASLMTGETFTKYDITTVLEAVKMARRRVNPLLDDNYIDGINYASFSGQFAQEAFTAPNSAQPTEEDDIAAMAKRFAPIKKETSNAQYTVQFDGSNTAVKPSEGN
jgi:hypothetical protein